MGKLIRRMEAAMGRGAGTAVFSSAVFLLLLQVLVLILALAGLAAASAFTPEPNRAFYIGLTVFAALLAAIALAGSLSGRYAVSLILTLSMIHAAPWLSILYERLTGSGDCIPMIYIIIPSQVSALFLSERAMIPIAAAQTAGFVYLVLTDPTHGRYNWVSLILFVLFASVLGAFTSYMFRRQYDKTLKSKTALERSERELRDISQRDALTGLYNRRHMEEVLAQLIQAPAARFGVAMLDVDRYKTVNDIYGHACGDQLIRALANALTALLGEREIACRYGGDEFLVIFSDRALPQAAARAEEIRRGLESARFACEGGPEITITASVGVSAYPDCGADRDSVLRAADRALYAAKHSGRNRVLVSDVEMAGK